MTCKNRKLFPKQQLAVDALRRDPSLSADMLIDIADIQGWEDNRARFILRLLNSGAVKLVVVED